MNHALFPLRGNAGNVDYGFATRTFQTRTGIRAGQDECHDRASWSIFAARMKSLSVMPSILCVQGTTGALGGFWSSVVPDWRIVSEYAVTQPLSGSQAGQQTVSGETRRSLFYPVGYDQFQWWVTFKRV